MNDKMPLEELKQYKKVIIWGAGYHTQEILRFYASYFHKVNLEVVDINRNGSYIEQYPIFSPDEIDFSTVDLVVIMSAIHYSSIVETLINHFGYKKSTVGLYEFRRTLLELSSYEECKCHINDFIMHMENGLESYSYDYILHTKYAKYTKIKLFAFWASSIGESIRYLLAYYYEIYMNKRDEEFYLLVPYIKGNDFANGRFMEIISRKLPMITYADCHFWKYAIEKYPERFDLENYNDYNGILVDAYNQFDERIKNICFMDKTFDLITYTSQEEKEIRAFLKKMNLSENQEYVCVFTRDNVYLEHQYGQKYSGNDSRNMDISLFKESVDRLKEQRIQSVRMGKHMREMREIPGCIDYASQFQDDLMDVYLCGNCKFFMGNISGIVELAHIQKVPSLLIGVVQIAIYNSFCYRSGDIYVPQKVMDKKTGRFLTFTEMWDAEMEAREQLQKYYLEKELVFIQPTAIEIAEAALEMNDKIDGKYIESEEEKVLQKKYHKLLGSWIQRNKYEYSYFLHCDVSGTFLKGNKFLLG